MNTNEDNRESRDRAHAYDDIDEGARDQARAAHEMLKRGGEVVVIGRGAFFRAFGNAPDDTRGKR